MLNVAKKIKWYGAIRKTELSHENKTLQEKLDYDF